MWKQSGFFYLFNNQLVTIHFVSLLNLFQNLKSHYKSLCQSVFKIAEGYLFLKQDGILANTTQKRVLIKILSNESN